jgi:DNA repair protein RecO (recombination protein O)
MGLCETNAIVLRNYYLSESDKIVLFLTQNYGLIRGVAKGARRLKSRFGSGLEPLSIVTLGYFEKEQRELVSINNVELQESYFTKASDFGLLTRFSYLIGLLTEFLPPNDADEILFRMTRACLVAVEPDNLDFITIYFEVWLLKQSGYLPNFTKCFKCDTVFGASDNQIFTTSFEVACFNCVKKEGKCVIQANERVIINQIMKLSPADFCIFAKNFVHDIQNLSAVTQIIISNVIGKK